MMLKRLQTQLAVLLFLLPTTSVWAAQITQVKNNKTMLDLSGGMESAQVGEELFAVDAQGKKKAILRIEKVKNGKAIAVIVKGKAQVGHSLAPRASKAMSREVRADDAQAGDDSSAYYKGLRKKTGNSWGVMGGYQMTTMSVTFKPSAGRTVTADLKGSSFGVVGYYDYLISPGFFLRGMGGVEQLSANASLSSADCNKGTSTNCTFSATALSFYGQAKYHYMETKTWRGWVGGGFGFMLFASKSSNVINTEELSSNQLYEIATGVDIPMGRRNYIPVSFEYGIFPSSDTVKNATNIILRAGYAWTL